RRRCSMQGSGSSAAGGSTVPSPPELFVPRLQHAAEPLPVAGGGARQQGDPGGDGLFFLVVAEEDRFHSRLEVLLAVAEFAPGDVAARARGARAERRTE